MEQYLRDSLWKTYFWVLNVRRTCLIMINIRKIDVQICLTNNFAYLVRGVICSMYLRLKPKGGCSSSIIKRWTFSSLFNVQKMMFKSKRCLIEWFRTSKYRKHLLEWHKNCRHSKVQKYFYFETECLWEGKTSTTSIQCCPFYVWATTTVIFKMRLRAFYCYVLRFLVFSLSLTSHSFLCFQNVFWKGTKVLKQKNAPSHQSIITLCWNITLHKIVSGKVHNSGSTSWSGGRHAQ